MKSISPAEKTMKTLKNEKGLDLKPCLNCVLSSGSRFSETYICPCPNFSGEKLSDNDKIVSFRCENRKMHALPRKPQGTPETQEKKT